MKCIIPHNMKDLEMSKVYELNVVRSNQIVAGKRYIVQIHGQKAKMMKAVSVPEVPLSKMTPNDKFVFVTAGGIEHVFHTHGKKGPQFLITKIKNKRGVMVNARVTFFKRKAVENVVDEPVKAVA